VFCKGIVEVIENHNFMTKIKVFKLINVTIFEENFKISNAQNKARTQNRDFRYKHKIIHRNNVYKYCLNNLINLHKLKVFKLG